MGEVKLLYRRNLPHYQPTNATFFVTFRIAGSLPQNVLSQLMREENTAKQIISRLTDNSLRIRQKILQQKKYFLRFDNGLDEQLTNTDWLRNEDVARLVCYALCYPDGDLYDLIAYTIMPNHVHMVFTVKRSNTSLYKILQSLKSVTARKANKILQREGAFWLHESYDHVVRDEQELEKIVWYVLNNPVKAHLVKEWQDWPWSYCRSDMVERFGGQVRTDDVANETD